MKSAFARPVHAGFVLAVCSSIFVVSCGTKRTHANIPNAPARIGSIETGIASWYGIPYDGRRTASGEVYDMEDHTAAHRNLPFQTWVEVTNLENGRRVEVRITDRGPFVRGRIIDLSQAAARDIDMIRPGTARVRLKVIAPPREDPRGENSGYVLAKSKTSVPGGSLGANSSGVSDVTAKVRAGDSLDLSGEPQSGTDVLPQGQNQSDPSASSTASSAPQSMVPGRAVLAGGSPVQPSLPLYAVQAGAFVDRRRAEALRAEMEEAYMDARVILDAQRRPQFWKVLVGREMTMEQANELATRVRQGAGTAMVVPEPYSAPGAAVPKRETP